MKLFNKKKGLTCFIIAVIVFISFTSLSSDAFAAIKKGNVAPVAKAKDYVMSPSEIYIDGVKVNYPVKPIVKDGTTLVPIRETFEAMGAAVNWNQAEMSVYATKGNNHINLKIGSHQASVNAGQVQLIQAPIIYKDKTMIPLRFVGEAFNGTVNYDNDTKAIEIAIAKSKFLSDFLVKEQGGISNIQNVENAQLLNNRRLMLSDNPETLDHATINESNATLWNDVIKQGSNSLDHRVVGWHTNKFAEDVIIGITIENLSSTNRIQVSNSKGVHKISKDSYDYDVGLPMAEAVLNNQLSNKPVKNGDQEILLDYFILKSEDMVGFLNDFTVTRASGTGELNYVIRTVVTRNKSTLTDIKATPVPLDYKRPHPRGVWSSSELLATLPVYDVCQGAEQSYDISNGISDNLHNVSNSLVTNESSISNVGHYGAVYHVKIPYVNTCKANETLRVRIGSRGGIYSGTVKTEKGVFNILSLNPKTEVVNILDRKVTNNEGYIELEFMHAGGSFLPIAVNLTTIN